MTKFVPYCHLVACTFFATPYILPASGRIQDNLWLPQPDHPLQYQPNEADVVSYYHYVQEVLYPFPQFPEGIPAAEKHKVINDIKDKRRDILKQFFHDNQPGRGYVDQ